LEIAAVWRLGVTLKGGHIPRAEYARMRGKLNPDFTSIFELLYFPQLIAHDA
jgi:hypothetical protein